MKLRKIKSYEEGYALVLAIFTVAIMGILASFFLTNIFTDLKTTNCYEAKSKSIYAAESGVNMLIWSEKSNTGFFDSLNQNVLQGPYDLKYDIGQYSYTLQQISSQSDGNLYVFEVNGQNQGAQTAIKVTLKVVNGNNNGNNGNHYGNDGNNGNHYGNDGNNGNGNGNSPSITIIDWHEI